MMERRGSFGLCTSFDMNRIDRVLDKYGITSAERGIYYAFCSSVKSSRKVYDEETLKKVIDGYIDKMCRKEDEMCREKEEKILIELAKILRPEIGI